LLFLEMDTYLKQHAFILNVHYFLSFKENRSSVSPATSEGLNGGGLAFRFPAEETNFSLLHSYHTRYEANPASIQWGLFHRDKEIGA
jgi:hypothetical protein